MGLLDFFRKKPKEPTAKVTLKMTYRTPDGREIDTDSDEFRAIQADAARQREEELRQREERQERNKAFLSDNGVDVDGFYPEKVVADAFAIIDGICPPMTRFDHGMRYEMPVVTFSSPTRTGKVPKNVVTAHLSHEDVREVPTEFPGVTVPEYGDMINITLHYLASGLVNKADVNASHGNTFISVNIRNVSGNLRITGGQVTLMKTNEVFALFPGEVPEDPGEAVAVLENEVDSAFKR